MRDGSAFDTLGATGLMNGGLVNGAHMDETAQAAISQASAVETTLLAPSAQQADYLPFADLPVLDRLRTSD